MLLAAELLERIARQLPRQPGAGREILVCEHEGDRITHDIIDRLNHTFVTPIDREDILALASALDDIVDYTEEVADYLGLYKIEAPMDQAISLAARAERGVPGDRRGDPAAARIQPEHLRSTPSRSTGSRTRATGSPARRSRRCSTRASTRWW